MQGDKFHRFHQKKGGENNHCFLRSVVMQLPLSQGTREVQSEVLQSSHIGSMYFLREGEVVTKIAEAGVHSPTCPQGMSCFLELLFLLKTAWCELVWLDAPFSKIFFWISTILSLCSIGVKSRSFPVYAKPCFLPK